MKPATIRSILISVWLLSAPRVLAWNDCGHMAIAALAFDRLTPAARAQAADLLRRNPDYSEWIKNVEPGARERVAFMRAATWADAIRSDPSYRDSDRRPPHDASGYGYREKRLHRTWHYINTPLSADGTAVRAAAEPNLHTQLVRLRAGLRAPRSADERSFSLVWLLHLVGDAHQPLHAAARFSRDFPHGDQGGNAVVLCERTCDRNLHGFWDAALCTTEKPPAIRRLIAALPKVPPAQAAVLDEAVWLRESHVLARDVAYAAPVGADADSKRLDERYKTAARTTAKQRTALAGARLANVLNEALIERNAARNSKLHSR